MVERTFIRLAFLVFIPFVTLSSQQETKIYTVTDKEVTPPRLVSKGKLKVSTSNQEAIRSGVVRLQIVITEKATVQVTKVIQGLGKVQDAAAIDAAKRTVFEPARLKDKPVRYLAVIEFPIQ